MDKGLTNQLRGNHGSSVDSLNDRFVKCPSCNVNLPKEDVKKLAKCTVCKKPFPESTSNKTAGNAGKNGTGNLTTVNFESVSVKSAGKGPRKQGQGRRKRWVKLQAKDGNDYYHNTETGEDRWTQPPDFEADYTAPFPKIDPDEKLKKVILHEEKKREAQKYGVPLSALETTEDEIEEQLSGEGYQPPHSFLTQPKEGGEGENCTEAESESDHGQSNQNNELGGGSSCLIM